jgi:hypothetical protein
MDGEPPDRKNKRDQTGLAWRFPELKNMIKILYHIFRKKKLRFPIFHAKTPAPPCLADAMDAFGRVSP